MGERLPDWKSTANLVRKIAENYKLPYYTMSPTYSICKEHGYIKGEEYTCPICGKDTEVYSRITGYYRPVKNWNTGKSEEFKERKEYSFNKAQETLDEPEEFVCESCQVSNEIEKESETKSMNDFKDGDYLFTTKTCPNCTFIKTKFAEMNVNVNELDVMNYRDLAMSLNIMSAPTLVRVKNGKVEAQASGVPNILKLF